ncbi:class I SAM-dependent methyltransferase [Chloroflexota bacterium]
MKRAIIKKLMKISEVFPAPDNYGLKELFFHPSFTEADAEKRGDIMLKSARWNHDNEVQYPWDRYFRFDLASLLKDKVVLDLGCFTGGKSIAWAERYQVKKMYGIDPSDVFIEAARKFTEEKGLEAEFRVSVGEELPFENEQFDAILSFDVFEHVRNLKDVLLECRRVLKKGGVLLSVFSGYFHPFEHHLNGVTQTPFLHYLFQGRELVAVYNEIIDERGDEATWCRRSPRDLEPWEKCNEINGTTRRKFARLVKETDWRVRYRGRVALGRAGGRTVAKIPLAKFVSYVLQPFALLPLLDEVFCQPIVYALEKP